MKVIILAGGSGSRLYPLSTPDKPKQFLKLIDDKPLLVLTVERFLAICKIQDIVIVTGEKYKQLTKECLMDYSLSEVNIVCEPAARNTAPAISLAVRYCKDVLKSKEDEPVFVAPSDHIIYPVESFTQLVEKLMLNTTNASITLLGVLPTRPDTEYGYIKAEIDEKEFKTVESFKEKPTKEVAEQYLQDGNYYWNAGMFAFNTASFETELRLNDKNLYNFYILGYEEMLKTFEKQEKISIDYAIVEKLNSIQVLPMTCNWTDIGSFKALYDFMDKDTDGNVIIGKAKVENLKNCLIIANSNDSQIMNYQIYFKENNNE